MSFGGIRGVKSLPTNKPGFSIEVKLAKKDIRGWLICKMISVHEFQRETPSNMANRYEGSSK